MVYSINNNGVIIPNARLDIKTTNPNPDYQPTHQKFDQAARMTEIVQRFGNQGFGDFSVEQAVTACNAARQEVAQGSLAKILRGPCLSLVLPETINTDYGTEFLNRFLPVAKKGYEQDCPGKVLQIVPPTNNLEGNFYPVGRHANLWMTPTGRSPSAYLYFPYALLGTSPSGSRVLEEHLPEGFSLAGPITNAGALVGYSDFLLTQQWVVDCPGAYWFTPEESVYFQRQRWGAVLYTGLDSQDENFSPGLVFKVKM